MAYQVQKTYKLIISGDMSASITSRVQEIQYQDNIGIQLNWTGTPLGAFSVEVSMDYAQDINNNITNAGHWIALPITPTIAAAGTPDSAYIDLNQLSAPYMRVKYTKISGLGALNAYVTGKAV